MKVPARRSVLVVVTAAATALGVIVVGSLSLASPAGAVPGTPQPGTVLFQEDFEAAQTSPPVALTDYQSVNAGPGSALGTTYSADPDWLPPATGGVSRCNGWIVDQAAGLAAPASDPECSGTAPTPWTMLKDLAYAVGVAQGLSTAASNHVVAAYTNSSTAQPAGVMFETTSATIIPTVGHYYAASVWSVATNCVADIGGAHYDPSLTLSLKINGSATWQPLVSNQNPCTAPALRDGTGTLITAQGRHIHAAKFVSSAIMATTADALQLQISNATANGSGNDAAYDLPQIIDVTPQLDKVFNQTRNITTPVDDTVLQGGTSWLTFTITNTDELGAKLGWSFTDNLPTGVTVATGTPTTTCANGTVTTTNTTVAVTGDLTAGQASCTVSVPVTASTVGDHINGPGNISSPYGVLLPSNAHLRAAALTVDKQVTPPAVWAAGEQLEYTVVITNDSPNDLTSLTWDDSGISVASGDPSVGLGAYSDPVCNPAAVTATAPLASGDSVTCTYTYTLTQFDLDVLEPLDNTVTASGTDSSGLNLTGSADASITPVLNDVIQPPVVVKNVDLTQAMAGNQLTYTYSVTNPDTNNISMHLIYQDVFDGSPMLTGQTCDLDPASTDVLVVGEPVAPEDIMTTLWLDDPWTAPTDGIGDGLSGAAVRLLPGQTVKCIFDPYTVTGTDAAAQSVNNKVTVYAYPLSTNEAMGPVTSAVKTLILTGGTVAPSGTTTVSITPAGPAAVLRKQGRLI